MPLHRRLFALAWPLLLVACSSGPVAPVALPEMPRLGDPVALGDAPEHEFDFWLGEWDVQNKHLRGGEWVDSGQARALIQSVAGGNGVLEQWNGALGGDPLIGFSLRAFDPALDRWAVYLNWHGGTPGGFSRMDGYRNGERMELFPPGDRSGFRYSFSLAHVDSCQWDQATSSDGESWITDWVMQFTRRGAGTAVDAANAPIEAPPNSAMRYHQLRNLDYLIGAWRGRALRIDADGRRKGGRVSFRASSMIEGFGVLLYFDSSWGESEFAAAGFDAERKQWVALHVDSTTPGIREMNGEVGDISYRFSGTGADGQRIRESWQHFKRDAFQFERAVSQDAGETWQERLTVEFERIEPAPVSER